VRTEVEFTGRQDPTHERRVQALISRRDRVNDEAKVQDLVLHENQGQIRLVSYPHSFSTEVVVFTSPVPLNLLLAR
jgi:hypothetical protein